MNRLALAALLLGLLAAPVANTGTSVLENPYTRQDHVGGTNTPVGTIAFVGDVQKVFNIQDPTNTDRTYSLNIARRLVAQLIAYRVEAVVYLGDLTNSTGSNSSYANDPNTLGTAQDQEWVDFRREFYDPLIAAGIPVFLIFGNHDSCVDVLRWFPLSEWGGYSWARSSLSRASLCGPSAQALTVNRSALIPTRIGTLCFVGAGFYSPDATEQAWVNAEVGCGSGRPTCVITHNSPTNGSWITPAGNTEIFCAFGGHLTPTPPVPLLTTALLSGGGGTYQYIDGFINHQIVRECNRVDSPVGVRAQTGLGWWALMTITPSANTVSVIAKNPIFGGPVQHRCVGYGVDIYDPDQTEQYTHDNETFSFASPWCTRFPGGPGC